MKEKLLVSRIALFLIMAIVLAACSGGGGGGSDSAPNTQDVTSVQDSPSVQVLPSDYNFGIVTLGNAPVPLEAKIQNSGSADLKVSDIVLSDMNNFALDLGGGSNPCFSSSPTVIAGGFCTVTVTFIPQFAEALGHPFVDVQRCELKLREAAELGCRPRDPQQMLEAFMRSADAWPLFPGDTDPPLL